MLEEKCAEIDTANQKCKSWKMMLNYYEMYSRLIRSASARLLVKLQVLGSLLHSKTNEKHEKFEEGDKDDLHFSRDLELKLAKKTKMLAKRNTEIEMLKVQNNKLVTELKQEEETEAPTTSS